MQLYLPTITAASPAIRDLFPPSWTYRVSLPALRALLERPRLYSTELAYYMQDSPSFVISNSCTSTQATKLVTSIYLYTEYKQNQLAGY